MLDGPRKFVRERVDKLSSRRPEELARTLAERGQARKEQATRIARDVVEWSKKNREVIADVVQREVRRQIARLGVATKDEVNSLRKRVRDLEGEARPKKASARKTPGTPTAKRNATGPGAPRATKTGAKKTASRKTAAKKTAAKSSRPPRRA